jgi:hypothetical protein
MRRYVTKNTASVIGGVLLSLLVFTLYRFYRSARVVAQDVIIEHVEQIGKVLENIDATCEIVAIVRDRALIDFLQVQAFVGNQIGPLQLRQPEKWHGPYLDHNPLIQDIPYELVKTREGFYVVPGRGVRLDNGKIIGKDITFTSETDIGMYLNETWGLESPDGLLVRKVLFKHLMQNAFQPLSNEAAEVSI